MNRDEADRLELARLEMERKQFCLPCRNSIRLEDDARCDGCLYLERLCGHDCYWLILDMEGKT